MYKWILARNRFNYAYSQTTNKLKKNYTKMPAMSPLYFLQYVVVETNLGWMLFWLSRVYAEQYFMTRANGSSHN